MLLNMFTMFSIIFAGVISFEENFLLNSNLMSTTNKWRIVNDGVMGGLSSSKVIVKNDKIMFSGNVSLENNGGFASLRSPVMDYNFEKFSGIEIKIKGDGKRYSISMKETTYFTGLFYTFTFETKKDEWIVVLILFNQLKPHYFGKKMKSGKQLTTNNVKEISLLIGDKQEGNFTAEIDYIKLYKLN